MNKPDEASGTALSLPLADKARVEDLLERLANELTLEISGDTVLVGILRRGAPLAALLATRLAALGVPEFPVGELKLKRYSDDLELLHDRPELDSGTLDVEVAGKQVVLVDDVLYSGESLFRAACFLREQGARVIRTVVLCQRGRPTMPVHADHVGLRLDVGENWILECQVPPYEAELGIEIKQRPAE